MPAPRKLDLIPDTLRERLAQTLKDRGFGDIMLVTDELNDWLRDEGLEIRIGKTAVGTFSKLLKDQREAFAMAETLLSDMDIAAESDMHRALMQMIGTAMFQMMQAMSQDGETHDPKSLANLARTLKDLMHSAGLREKIMADERARLAREVKAQAADAVESKAAQMGLTAETVTTIRAAILGVSG